jgi:hypothetical protein
MPFFMYTDWGKYMWACGEKVTAYEPGWESLSKSHDVGNQISDIRAFKTVKNKFLLFKQYFVMEAQED